MPRPALRPFGGQAALPFRFEDRALRVHLLNLGREQYTRRRAGVRPWWRCPGESRAAMPSTVRQFRISGDVRPAKATGDRSDITIVFQDPRILILDHKSRRWEFTLVRHPRFSRSSIDSALRTW